MSSVNQQAAIRPYDVAFAEFRKTVDGNRVLDGDLRMTSIDEGRNTASIQKVNYGGAFKRWIYKPASTTTKAQENISARKTFLASAQKYINENLPEGRTREDLIEKITAELTSDENISAPLSRRTVKLVVTAIDRADPTKTANNSAAVPKDALTVETRFGKFTLTKAQYTAMFDQVLHKLKKSTDIAQEQLAVYTAQIKGYLAAFEKNKNLGNLGVFFLGSMDMATVTKKVTEYFLHGILPPRANKGQAKVKMLSDNMAMELKQLRALRMSEGDQHLAKKVNVASLHPANAKDVEGAGQKQPNRQGADVPGEADPLRRDSMFVADLVFNDNLLEMEEYQFDDGERIAQTLSKHFEAFKDLCKAVKEFDSTRPGPPPKLGAADIGELAKKSNFFKCLDHLCPVEGDEGGNAKTALFESIVTMVRRVNEELFNSKPDDPSITRAVLYTHSEAFYNIAAESKVEERLDAVLKASARTISRKIVETLGGDPNEQAGNDVESLERINDTLLNKLLPIYFVDADAISLRQMFASSIRMSREPVDELVKEDGHPDYGAFLMGSGPFMLKLLQGFDVSRLAGLGDDADTQQIVNGVNRIKSEMPGLDFEIIYAHVNALGNGGECPFKSITMNEQLGAASVGVTYDCEITVDNGGSEQKKKVALKMLRPGVGEQLKKERERILAAATSTDLEREVKQTYNSIQRELNLKDEFTGLKKGREVYCQQGNHDTEYELDDGRKLKITEPDMVDSVKPVVTGGGKEIDATETTLIMELVPGGSVAAYLGKINDEKKSAFGFGDCTDMADLQEKVTGKRQKLQKLHTAMLQVAAKLVSGICKGKGGYFHGDLHAGNMMYDEAAGKLTLIDYGKGTFLNEAQADVIRQLLAIAAVGDEVSPYLVAESLLKAYDQIMATEGGDAKEAKQETRDRLLEEFLRIAKGGIGGGIELLAAFGRAAKLAGAEMPLVFFDFFGTCGKLDGEIRQVEKAIGDVDAAYLKTDLFKNKCTELTGRLVKCVNDSELFKSNYVNGSMIQDGTVGAFGSGSAFDTAIRVIAGLLKKIPLGGIGSVLKKNFADHEYDFGGNAKLDMKEIANLNPDASDSKEPEVYQVNQDVEVGQDKSLAFITKQMRGLLTGIARLQQTLRDDPGKLADESVQKEIDMIQGLASAFRKMIRNKPVKEVLPNEWEALRKIARDCETAKKKWSHGNDLSGVKKQLADWIETLGDKTKWSKASLVKAIIYAKSIAGYSLRGKINGQELSEIESSEVIKLLQDFCNDERNGLTEDERIAACVTALESGNDPMTDGDWGGLAGNLKRHYEDGLKYLNDFSNDLDEMIGGTKGPAGGKANKELIAGSRQMLNTPEDELLPVLDGIDGVLGEIDDLYRTMKGDITIHKNAYVGGTDTRLPRSFHLYTEERRWGDREEDEEEYKVKEALYKDDIKFDKGKYGRSVHEMNMAVPLEESERKEYADLYEHIRANYSHNDEVGPDVLFGYPEANAAGLTRKDLANLRELIRDLEFALSPGKDSVSSVMQNEINALYATGIGKETDSDEVKVFMDRVDKTKKLRKDKDLAATNEMVEDFFKTCDEIKETAGGSFVPQEPEKLVEWVEKIVKLANLKDELKKKTGSEKKLADLELNRHELENDCEIRYHIRKIGRTVAKEGWPTGSDEELVKTLKEEIAKLVDKRIEEVKGRLAEISGVRLLSESFTSEILESVKDTLTCLFLEACVENALKNDDETDFDGIGKLIKNLKSEE